MIYLDHAATTKPHPSVQKAMLPFLSESYGNPSSIYHHGQSARQAIQLARTQVASLLHTSPDNIFFTSGGTEADNWALIGCARQYASRGKHIIISAIEHPAILRTAEYLEQTGFSITRLPVTKAGFVTPSSLLDAIRPDTILVSIMLANNEIGTIQPIQTLAAIAHAHDILFHTDAVQAVGQIDVDVTQLSVDLLSVSAHKLYGPKGCGCLYVRQGLPFMPLLFGGGQEKALRSGTENTAGIVGFGKAAELALSCLLKEQKHLTMLRDFFIDALSDIPHTKINGSLTYRLPNNINVSFAYTDGASLPLLLDEYGICVSAGSACSASSHKTSHVLSAIGLSDELCRSTIRITLGRETTKEELYTTLRILKQLVENLRQLHSGI